jgi:hypothetical protein
MDDLKKRLEALELTTDINPVSNRKTDGLLYAQCKDDVIDEVEIVNFKRYSKLGKEAREEIDQINAQEQDLDAFLDADELDNELNLDAPANENDIFNDLDQSVIMNGDPAELDGDGEILNALINEELEVEKREKNLNEQENLKQQAIKEAKSLRSRRYRNRRLGEFLKELELTEGRATGIPTIQKALSENGSSLATIETDESRTYFMMDIPCHPDFVKNVLVDVQVECLDLKQVAMKISQLCPSYRLVVSQSDIEKLAQCLLRATTEVSGHDMLDGIDTTSYKQRKRKYLDQLITIGLVEMTKPDKPTASDQKYRCTTLGKQMIMGDRTIKS